MSSLCVLLLHSTDEPDLAVAALHAARGAVASGQPGALFLAGEGVRVAAKGVLEALSSGGRPDLADVLRDFLARGGRVHVSEACLRARQFAPDALLPGVVLEPEDGLSRLAAEGWVFASF
jgi:predicted peroxiredoxin